MLAPDFRCLFTDLVTPPVGKVFSGCVATTYSLDMTTLLALPLTLSFADALGNEEALSDGVALLDALRRTASRIRVFCERGRIGVPEQKHLLYGLLEGVVVDVDPPSGGAFHPKVWLLKFTDPSGEGSVFRLLVSSRNITSSNSWDLALRLEGAPTDTVQEANRPISALLRGLLGAGRSPSPGTDSLLDELAGEVERIRWELPPGYYDVKFHLLGMGRGGWLPEPSSSLVVVSPFVSGGALAALAKLSQQPLALISRSEELDRLEPSVRERFRTALILHEAAEAEDGEDVAGSEAGLHAKAYLYREWYNTHVVVGSANATVNALLGGVNVEFLAELIGKDREVGKPEDILAERGGLGELLTEYQALEPDAVMPAANQSLLEHCRERLLEADLRLQFQPVGDAWRPLLMVVNDLLFEEEVQLRAWPVTLHRDQAVAFNSLQSGEAVCLPEIAASSLTGFIAFEMVSGEEKVCFVLNLPMENLPRERDFAIVRMVIQNREGFLRYLLMLLGEMESVAFTAGAGGDFGRWLKRSGGGDLMLLETLVAALSRSPEKLRQADVFVQRLLESGESEGLFPDGFLDVWQVFMHALSQMET